MKGIERPEPIILSDNDMIPSINLITPAPNQFTHRVIRKEPFYFNRPQQATPADGEFAAGTKVILMVHNNDSYCHIADEQGLYVIIAYNSLEKLT